jgi:hypothetical protein
MLIVINAQNSLNEFEILSMWRPLLEIAKQVTRLNVAW